MNVVQTDPEQDTRLESLWLLSFPLISELQQSSMDHRWWLKYRKSCNSLLIRLLNWSFYQVGRNNCELKKSTQHWSWVAPQCKSLNIQLQVHWSARGWQTPLGLQKGPKTRLKAACLPCGIFIHIQPRNCWEPSQLLHHFLLSGCCVANLRGVCHTPRWQLHELTQINQKILQIHLYPLIPGWKVAKL